jgi:hypothetical protein
MGTEGLFPRGEVQLGCDADHSTPSSAEVKNEWELYLLSLSALHRCVVVLLSLLKICIHMEELKSLIS